MRTVAFLLCFLSSFSIATTGAKVIDPMCVACATPTGLSSSGLNGDTATLSWDAVPGANLYKIEIEDEQNTPNSYHVETHVSGTTFTTVGLQAGATYKFKVRSICGSEKSEWSNWVYLNGNSGGGSNGPCDAPGGLSANAVGNGTYLLSWTKVSTAVQYQIEVEDEQNNPSNFHVELPVADTFYEISGLQAGVLYKYKVRSLCGNTKSDWTPWLFFNGNFGGGNGFGICQKPTNLSVSILSATEAILQWDTVAGVTSYALEVKKEGSGVPWKINQVVTNIHSFSLTNLLPNTTYKFKVRSICPTGSHSAWSKKKKFKTPNMGTQPDDEINASEDRSISTENTSLQLTIAPNPTYEKAQITIWSNVEAAATVQCFSITGTLTQSQQLTLRKGQNAHNLSLAGLDPGVYFIQIQSGSRVATAKLLLLR